MSGVEIIADGGRRRRWSAAEKLRVVEETLEGRTGISVVVRRNGVGANLLAVVETANRVFVYWGAIAWDTVWIDHVIEVKQTDVTSYLDLSCQGTTNLRASGTCWRKTGTASRRTSSRSCVGQLVLDGWLEAVTLETMPDEIACEHRLQMATRILKGWRVDPFGQSKALR